MKIFKDKELTQEVEVLDLGIVPAGETKKYTFFVYNELKADLKELEFKIAHKEVKILSSPVLMNAESKDDLVIEWSPSITLKEGLKAALLIDGLELWS